MSNASRLNSLHSLSSMDWLEICQFLSPCDTFRISQINQNLFYDFFPFHDQQQQEENIKFNWTISWIQEKIVHHLECTVQKYYYLTIEEEELLSKMKNKTISNRKELKDCLRLYLKFNFIVMQTNDCDDYEFILRLKGEQLTRGAIHEEEEGMPYYDTLLENLSIQYKQSMDTVKNDHDIYLIHGFRENGGTYFHITEMKREEFNNQQQPLQFNYSHEFPFDGIVFPKKSERALHHDQDDIMEYVQIITSSEPFTKHMVFCHIKQPYNGPIVGMLTKQVFELPKRNITVHMNRLKRYGERRDELVELWQYPLTFQITKSPFSAWYEFPFETLMNPSVLRVVMRELFILGAFLAFVYYNCKVFGFLSFYNTRCMFFDAFSNCFSLLGVFDLLLWFAYWALFAIYGMVVPVQIFYSKINRTFGRIERGLFILYYLACVVMDWKGIEVVVESSLIKYILAPFEVFHLGVVLVLVLDPSSSYCILDSYHKVAYWTGQVFQQVKKSCFKVIDFIKSKFH